MRRPEERIRVRFTIDRVLKSADDSRYNTKSQYEVYKSEYVKLYVDTVKATVMSVDKTRTFLVSSPTNGVKSDEEGYVSKNPYSPLYGDSEYFRIFNLDCKRHVHIVR